MGAGDIMGAGVVWVLGIYGCWGSVGAEDILVLG